MTHFSFSPRTLLKNIFIILFLELLPFFRQINNSTLPKLLSLWAKSCSQCLLQLSRELKFFPLREFCKGKNKVKQEGAMPGGYSRWIRTFRPSCNDFCLIIKETCGLALSWWKIMHFLLTNSGCFSSSASFSWSNWEKYLLELILWFSWRSS